MPNPKSYRKGKLTEKSSSFHGEKPSKTAATLRRPKTDPELLSFKNLGLSAPSLDGRPKMTKLLFNVTIQGSLGPVQVLMSPDMTVADLVAATVRQYLKEARRPILPTADPSAFDLHYSQFSLESLNEDEKLIALGSRNFFLCPRKSEDNDDLLASSSSSSCSTQAKENAKSSSGFSWFKFIEFRI
ncbi:uncharacterized protein At4g22758-like [Cucurbita pepo subsp. pepo]|uniref:uncharacterized protein At4g22758-like n=1 Tax=Cucurbita pepo subsp. pepo TaxID=3664 RepID=UPI000C9DA2D1|nr:uncharacterized protein At4g22758-like [Cucurbita pepo subsp. pepo]